MEWQSLLNIPQLRYWAQDESRIDRKTKTPRVMTAKGVKPKASVEWPREAFWLYGVVEPLSGCRWTESYDKLKGENFQPFLEALSQQLGDTVAVMQLDGAPAHRAKT